jgi:hypothetical protein
MNEPDTRIHVVLSHSFIYFVAAVISFIIISSTDPWRHTTTRPSTPLSVWASLCSHTEYFQNLLTQRRISSFFADEALVRIREAWYVLSDPIRLYQFEREIHEQGNGFSSTSFWTMCPYCCYLVSVRESMKIVHVWKL